MHYVIAFFLLALSAFAGPRNVRVFVSNSSAPAASSHVLMEFQPNGAWGHYWYLPAGATAVYDITIPDPTTGYNDFFRMRDAGGSSIVQMSSRTLEDYKAGFEALYINAASQSSGNIFPMEKSNPAGGSSAPAADDSERPNSEQAWTAFWLGVGLIVTCGVVLIYIVGIRKAVSQSL